MVTMKEAPPWLPPASSSKWHNRRLRDPLGYLRVRSLANPKWNRDVPWLTTVLRRTMVDTDGELRVLYGKAIDAAQRYPRTSGGATDPDAAWNDVLARIDAILEHQQRDHLDAVRDAGMSGKDVPRPGRPG